MNIVFFGTPDFARDFLEALHQDEQINICAVVAQPDKPVGRKQLLTPPATKVFAEENNIPVLQPEKLKDPVVLEELEKFNADVFVIVAYGKIIPQNILDIPKLGNVNVHPSKLPKYRGPSPLQAVIEAGDKETAISIMLIDDKMDHGPLLAQKTLLLDEQETPETLRTKVVKIGAPLLVSTLKDFIAGKIIAQDQDHEKATFCKLLEKENGQIDWQKTAEQIERQVRAYDPWPGTYTEIGTENSDQIQKLKIHEAVLIDPEWFREKLKPGEVKIFERRLLIGTGTAPLEILKLQPENKAIMDAKSYINGNQEINGKILGN